jgi:hypothetical protein
LKNLVSLRNRERMMSACCKARAIDNGGLFEAEHLVIHWCGCDIAV